MIYPITRMTLRPDELGLPWVDEFVSFDITDDPDPTMAEKIAALHQRRYEEDPALAELVSNLNSYGGSSAPGPHARQPTAGRGHPIRTMLLPRVAPPASSAMAVSTSASSYSAVMSMPTLPEVTSSSAWRALWPSRSGWVWLSRLRAFRQRGQPHATRTADATVSATAATATLSRADGHGDHGGTPVQRRLDRDRDTGEHRQHHQSGVVDLQAGPGV
jgi:hypothetical protein